MAYAPLAVARVMVSTAVPAPGSTYPPTGPTRDTSLPPSMRRTTCVVEGGGIGDFEQASQPHCGLPSGSERRSGSSRLRGAAMRPESQPQETRAVCTVAPPRRHSEHAA